jgi:hypothetical protein
VADGDHGRVLLLARAWKVAEGQVVRRLLDEFAESPASASDVIGESVAIYAEYDRQVVEAIFRSKTERVDITSGVLVGRSYKSPSGAAKAVVQSLNASVDPSRNGWMFWSLRETGEMLETIRRGRDSSSRVG